MSRLHCRGSLAWAVLIAGLFSAQSTHAQTVADPGLTGASAGLINESITGVLYDRLNQKNAERRFQHLQEKLWRDTVRGNTDAVGRDVRRIDYTRYRIAVNTWLIRKNSLLDPGYYPVRTDPISCAAIAQAASPPLYPLPSNLMQNGN